MLRHTGERLDEPLFLLSDVLLPLAGSPINLGRDLFDDLQA